VSLNKILILHPILVPYRIDIFNHLAERNDLDLVLSIRNSDINYFHEDDLISKLKCKAIFISDDTKISVLSLFVWLKKKLLATSPNIVIVSEFSVISLLVLTIRKLFYKKFKLVIWTDDNKALVKSDKFHRKLLRFLFVKYANGWIFVSDEIKKHYIKTYKIEEASTSLLPIIHKESTYNELIGKSTVIMPEYINKLSLKEKKIALFVGRLIKEKAVEDAIRSFERVKYNNCSVLVIVGVGAEELALKKLVQELGLQERILFVGYYEKEGLAAWYKLASVLILPSRHEAFGVVVNEALLCNTPVIVSDNVGAKSLIVEGTNGSIVPYGDIQEFSNKIQLWFSYDKVNEGSEYSLMPFKYEQFAKSLNDMLFKLNEL
jgi:glycosyltransferase involved in cell wall biosynthesis